MRRVPVRRALVLALAVELATGALGGLVVANAVLRPGCSLVPLNVPDDGSGRSMAISLAQACTILGRPVPAIRLPGGVQLVSVSAATGTPTGLPRSVRMTFAKGARDIATLDTLRVGTPRGNVKTNGTVGTRPAEVGTTYVLDGNFVDVGYHWFSDDMMFTLHVALVDGMTRTAADDMAASIR